ncbi:dTDP-glucose 4,6-dehydratase [Micromonospora sp. NPDC049460]|uniref:dTDP-glucose 4,6-dehydratase n=1 Tax=unclassified Micromonospora TaxID=2617518 RepID=UPI00371C9841
MSTILVTGAAGFIGSNFVRHWHRAHPRDRVVAFDLLTYSGTLANLADLGDAVTFVQGDIRDEPAVARALREHGVDVVVNFAAESHNSRAVLGPTAFFETNVLGPVALMEAVRRIGRDGIRFHQISTCEVYGDMALDDPGAFTEDSPYLPRTPYNAAKAGGDHAVRAFGHTYGIPFTITTCSNNYGPYQFPEKVIPLFVTHALRGMPLPVYASSRNRREWLHVADHCRAVEAVLLHGRLGETYNVGSGVEVDVETLADAVLRELGLGAELKRRVPDRPSHDRRYLLDSGKLRRELAWEPRIGFGDGLKATIAWYREHESWWRPLLDRVQVAEETAWR